MCHQVPPSNRGNAREPARTGSRLRPLGEGNKHHYPNGPRLQLGEIVNVQSCGDRRRCEKRSRSEVETRLHSTRSLGAELVTPRVRNPQANGKVERYHRTLKDKTNQKLTHMEQTLGPADTVDEMLRRMEEAVASVSPGLVGSSTLLTAHCFLG